MPGEPPRSRLGLWTLLALVLTAIMAFAGIAVFGLPKKIYAEYQAGLVSPALEKNDWRGAIKALSQANRFDPDNPKVLRASIEFLQKSRSDPRSQVNVIKQLIRLGHADADDYLRMGELLLELGEGNQARQVHEDLPEELKDTKQGLQLLAGIQRGEGLRIESEQTLRRALMKTPNDPDSKMRLAILDYGDSFPEIHQRARGILWQLVNEQDETALAAIRFLAADKRLTLPEANRLLQIVDAHPGVTNSARHDVLSAMVRLDPGRREEIFDQEMQRYQGKGIDQIQEIIRWLAKEKQHTRILTLVPPRSANEAPEIFPYVAQALGEEGRWADLRRLLTGSGPMPAPKARVEVWLAEAATHLEPGNSAASSSHLLTAVELAIQTNDHGTLAVAGHVAEKLGMYELAIRCCEKLATVSPGVNVAMLDKIYDLAERLRDAERMIETSRQLLHHRPSSGVFRDRVNYLLLLIGDSMELVDAELQQGTKGTYQEGGTSRLPPAFLRAFAAYRFRDLDRMNREMEALGSSYTRLPPGQRAVVARMLHSSGETSAAFRLAESLPEQVLLPQELALFHGKP